MNRVFKKERLQKAKLMLVPSATVMINACMLLLTKCNDWRVPRARMKKVPSTLTKRFVCKKCVETMKGAEELDEK